MIWAPPAECATLQPNSPAPATKCITAMSTARDLTGTQFLSFSSILKLKLKLNFFWFMFGHIYGNLGAEHIGQMGKLGYVAQM